jgi:hypothetical protein
MLQKHCKHGNALCFARKGMSNALNTIDKGLVKYGGVAGKALQTAAPAIAAVGGPTAGIAAGAIGKGMESYNSIRSQLGD